MIVDILLGKYMRLIQVGRMFRMEEQRPGISRLSL